jgi:hypothetical protein
MDVLIFMKIDQVLSAGVSNLFANLCRAETESLIQGCSGRKSGVRRAK